jgi:TRAP-type uncharacterized transport system substrate-binding protein
MAYAWEGSRSFADEGKIQSFRVIGGLYAEAVQLITMDPNIKSVADLKGKKVYTTGAGSNPEYIINYLLEKNNIDISCKYKLSK